MKSRKLFAILLVVGTVLMTTFSFYGYQIIRSPNILVGQQDRIFIIYPDETYDQVRDTLYKYKFINDIISFSFLSRLMNYDVSVKPGRYHLRANMNNVEAIRLLRAGIQEPTFVTFNNVRLKTDLADKITVNIQMTSGDFTEALIKFERSNNRGFDEYTSMCIFIPNTYEVYWSVSADALVDRMLAEYDQFWNNSRMEKAQKIGLNPMEISILASIVQAEASDAKEGPTIAGLYINRLRKDIPLQADPTLVYASGDFTLKRVLNIHKETDSPYNTYKYKGLPPGPINLPEIWALESVLNFEQHKYIYMCAKEDFSGSHNFATNLRDHNQNAARYQRALSIEQRKARQQGK